MPLLTLKLFFSPDCVLRLTQQEVRLCLLKSDNRSVGHSCWPTFLSQLHCIYHQGLLASSGLAVVQTSRWRSDPLPFPPSFSGEEEWVSVHICLQLFLTQMDCVQVISCGEQHAIVWR